MYKVYRVEHPVDGCGPYTTSVTVPFHLNGFFDETFDLPCSYTDFNHFVEGTHFIACQSPIQLQKWFGEYLFKFLDIGFQVVEYDVKDFQVGDSGLQIMFNKNDVIGKQTYLNYETVQ